jgi:hypothetical protein
MLDFLRRWFGPRKKAMPPSLTGGQWAGTSYVDSWKRTREPKPTQLLEELKGIAWACISLNAATCANFAPRLFVTTSGKQSQPKCRTKAISHDLEKRLRTKSQVARYTKAALTIEEVTNHPLLDLLYQPNPMHSAFDLWEMTTVYLETTGKCFWYTPHGPFGTPDEIWILPTQNVTPPLSRQHERGRLL